MDSNLLRCPPSASPGGVPGKEAAPESPLWWRPCPRSLREVSLTRPPSSSPSGSRSPGKWHETLERRRQNDVCEATPKTRIVGMALWAVIVIMAGSGSGSYPVVFGCRVGPCAGAFGRGPPPRWGSGSVSRRGTGPRWSLPPVRPPGPELQTDRQVSLLVDHRQDIYNNQLYLR